MRLFKIQDRICSLLLGTDSPTVGVVFLHGQEGDVRLTHRRGI